MWIVIVEFHRPRDPRYIQVDLLAPYVRDNDVRDWVLPSAGPARELHIDDIMENFEQSAM